MAKNTSLRTEIIITANAKQADATMKSVAQSMNNIKAQLNELKAKGEGDSPKAKWLTQLWQSLNSMSRESVKGIERVREVVANLSGQSVSQLRRARRAAQQFRDSLSENDAGFSEAESNLKKINTQIDLMTGKQRRLSDATKNFKGTLQNISTASIEKLNEALKDGEVMLNRMSKGEVERAGVVPGMANIRQEIANRRQMSAMQQQDYLYSIFRGNKTWNDISQRDITDRLSVAKESLKNMSFNDPGRAKLQEYISQAEMQLQKLNGTLVDTDRIINNTFQNKSASPKQLAEAINLIKQKLDALPASMTTDREKYNQMMATMIQRSRQLRGELVTSGDRIKRIGELVGAAGQKAGELPKRLKDLKTVPFDKLREAAKLMREELSKMSESDKNFQTMRRNVEKVENQLNKSTSAVNKHGSAWKTTIKNMMAYVGVFGILNMVKSKIEEIVGLNLKFSQQLADVRKVSGLTTQQVKELGNELSKIDSRTSLQGLMNTAYTGAKLGFGEYGVKGLTDFTKAFNVAQVAIGEEMGEEAGPAISKIVENMGLIKKYGVEQAMLKTASAMFKLSSTSTATSSAIVEFSKRLMSVSKVAGITTDQLLALGSASDTMFLAPEVSATSFTKMITALQTNHNILEKALDIPKGKINDLFSAGKAMEAILLIFHRMHDKGNMNALEPIFKPLGSEGTRLQVVMTSMAKNVDILEKHLRTSAEAFKEGTAATAEYNIQQETAEGLMERTKNLWQKAVMNPENVDVVREFAKAWYDVSKSLTTGAFAAWSLKTAISFLMWTFKSFLQLIPSLLVGLGAAGVYRVVIELASGFRVLSISCSRFTLVWKMMSVATRATWIGLVVTAIAGLTSVIAGLCSSAKDAKKALVDMNKVVSDAEAEGRKATLEVDKYVSAIKNAAIGTNERAVAIKKFNERFGAYYKNMLTEKATADDIAKAYAQVVKHLKEKMLYEGMQKDYEQSVGNRQVYSVYKLQAYDDAYKETGRSSLHDADWLQAKVKDMHAAGYGSVDKIFKAIIGEAIPIPDFGDYIAESFKSGKTASNISKDWGEDRSWFNDRKAGLAMYGYIAQEVQNWSQEGKFKKRWSHKQGEINDWLKFSASKDDEKPGSLDNDAPDEEAIKAAKAAAAAARNEARKHKKKLQDDLKAADGQVKSFTKAIDAYYTLQEKAIQELYMQGKINEAEMNRYIALMKSKHDMVASQGRFAIVGDENNFDDLRKQMGKGFDQFDYSAEAQKLLGIIQKADPTATGKLIRNLEGALGTTPDNSMMNDIRNVAVNNQKSESDRRLKLFQSADSYLNSKNYIDNVGRDYDSILSQAGLTDVGLDKGSKEAAGISTKRTRSYVNDKGEVETEVIPEPTESMRMNFVREGTKHYAVDSTSAADLRQWLDRFVSQDGKGVLITDEKGNKSVNADNMQSWTEYIPEIKNMLLGVGNEADSKIKFLFSTLMQYEEKYYEAKKQQLDYETKILESRWTRSADYKQGQEKERELEVKQHVQSIYGRGETGAFLNTKEMARNNGFADNIEGDPEVEKAKLRMVMARKEAETARKTSDDKLLITKQEQAAQDAELAYAEKVNSQIKARIDLLQQWVDPLQEFSEAMGDAFVKMTDSAEDGRDAMKQATEDMVKTFAKMTINMIAQQIKMEAQRALFHKRMQKSEGDYMEGMKDENEKGHKNIFKALGSFFKKKKKDTDKNDKDTKKSQQKSTKEQAGIVEEGKKDELEAVTKTATGKLNIEQKMETQSSQTKEATAASDAATTATETQGNVFAGIASGAAKIIAKLGWWGIPLIAVIQGLLMGLLSSALGKLFGGKNKTASNTNTKLVSGMLTYDSGNVEAFSGAIDKKTYPVVGNDGKVYAAKPTDQLVTGLLTEPVATTVNGVPSLVAERGPEMIIGRETTQALMMARPDIISEIVKFDRSHSGRTYKAYDSGNVSDVVGDLSVSSVSSPQQQAMQAGLADVVDTMQAMMPAMQAFVRQLQQPLKTSINMYGTGGLYDSMNRANKFMNAK